MVEQSKKEGVWAKHLDRLQKAIDEKHYDYRYEPGDYPPPFSVLVEYE